MNTIAKSWNRNRWLKTVVVAVFCLCCFSAVRAGVEVAIPAYEKLTPQARKEAERYDEMIADLRRNIAQPGHRADLVAEDKVLLAEMIQKRPKTIISVQKYTMEPDKTVGIPSVCPVHHKKMSAQRVPIGAAVMLQRSGMMASRKVKATQFPFGDAFIPGACFGGGGSPQFGKVYLCPDCELAKKAWVEDLRMPKAKDPKAK